MSQFGTITINSKEYDLDDFELDDMAQVEELCPRRVMAEDGTPTELTEPTPFGALDFAYTKTLKAFAYVILHKEDPEFTYEAAGKLKLIAFTSPDEAMPDTGPTVEEPSQNGSALEDSGAPASVTQLPGSAPGTLEG